VGDCDVHVEFVAAGFAGLPPQERAHRWPHVERIRLQRVGVVVEGLVLQALPDRQIGHDVDAELRQVRRRADAGAQQDRRTPVCAAGEDHLARRDLGAACGDDADRTTPVEHDAIDEDVA
jgi:hypothetical protein